MKITVTQEDIDKGIKDSPCKCPIALALIRAYPDKDIRVFYHRISEGLYRTRHTLPLVAQMFIANFDYDKPVFPFSFEIDL